MCSAAAARLECIGGSCRSRRRAIEGKVYPTLDDKVAAVEAELAKLKADPARIRSLAGWDWIDAAVQQLPMAHAA